MLKVCTSYFKKVPSDQQYSSQQFHASVEIELSDALSPEQLQQRIHETFAVVKNTVESEINGGGTPAPALAPRNGNGNGNGNGHAPAGRNGGEKATNAQAKFITSLATEQDIRLSALNEYIQSEYGVQSMYELTKKQASELVKALQQRKVKIPA